MKTPIQLLLIITMLMGSAKVVGQQEIKGNYRIYLNTDGKSSNKRVPILLEEDKETLDTLYTYDGRSATKTSKIAVVIDSSFSFKKIDPNFNYRSIIVDLDQKEEKLYIKPKECIADKFKTYNKGKGRRLFIDVNKGIKISRNSWKANAITIPLKVYLTNQSDSLPSFTNNTEADVNIALTYGKSWEKFSFKKGREAILANTKNVFGFIGLNQLTLSKKNTDGVNDGDTILTISPGVGYQLGYGKFGLSLLLGMDLPISSIGQNWVFKYQPWLGLGIGYSIFK